MTLVLQPADTTTVRVRDGRGAPIAGARVIDCRGAACGGISTTDAAGEAPIPIPAGEAHDVWVVPRDGSLGFVQLAGGSADGTVSVPDAPAAS